MFIYSRKDDVVDYKYVEQFAATQQAVYKNNVRMVEISAPHVQILRSNPEEFNEATSTFVSQAEATF